MERTLLKSLYVTLTSLGLALVFNYLFFGKLVGISVFIFVVIFLGSIFLFGQLNLKKTSWLVLLILFFSFMLAVRANEFLSFLNLVATLGLLLILAYELVGVPAFLMKLRDYITLAILVPLKMLGSTLSTLASLGKVHSSVENRDVWIRIFKGVLLALPVLLIFGVLFSQADLAFSKFVKSFVDISISERTLQYLILLFLSFTAGLGFLSYIFFAKEQGPITAETKTLEEKNRGIEVLVFLGLIASLFLLFIGFQVTYLFGGETNIVNAGFTYAEYARRGFWELLAVAALSLLVLLASEKYSGSENKRDNKFLVPALILVAEIIVVIVSAFKRLSLYIETYGMTDLRFYVATFIILLLVLFVLLGFKFIKSKPEQFFTFGTLLTTATFLIVINILNPHAFIVRANIEQYNKTGKIDIEYVNGLSADAVEGKIELYNKLQGHEKQILKENLQKQEEKLEKFSENWQSYNFSRSKALKLLDNF